MASIDYPKEILPKCLVNGNRHQERQRIIFTDMDSGYRVARKRFTSVPLDLNFQLLLDQSSLSYFQAWYKDTLDCGLNYFNMDIAVGVGANKSHECRFTSPPTYTMTGNLYRVESTIEAVEMAIGLDYNEVIEGLIASLGGVRGFDVTSTYIDKLDVAINQTYANSGYAGS